MGAAQCAIVRSIRTRTTSHDLDGRSKKPEHARAKSAKGSKKSTKSRKTKEKPFGPWPSLPTAVLKGGLASVCILSVLRRMATSSTSQSVAAALAGALAGAAIATLYGVKVANDREKRRAASMEHIERALNER